MMSINFPSFWVILGDDYSMQITAIVFTCVVCGIGGYLYLSKKMSSNQDDFYEMATWFVWSMLIFLPSMHERYAYLLDVLLVLLSYKDRRNFIYAVTAICASLFSYSSFLFNRDIGKMMVWVSILYFVMYSCYSYRLFVGKSPCQSVPSVGKNIV